MGGRRRVGASRRRRRRTAGRLLLGLLLAGALAAAGVAAAVRFWSGASLVADRTALARLELQPLAGSLVSARAFTAGGVEFPIGVEHGRLVPETAVPAGLTVRVEVVVRRPGWLARVAGRFRHERLTIRTPVASVADRWVTLARGAKLVLRFDQPVDRVVVRGRTVAVGGRRSVDLGRPPAPSGAVRVAAAARSWEQLGAAQRVTWFPKTRAPAVLVSPAPGATVSPLAAVRLVFAEPVAQVLGGARPALAPAAAGRWSEPDAHTLVFRPGGLGLPMGGRLSLRLARATSAGRTLRWTIAEGSLLRLHQLLAQEGYLPVDWQPDHAPVAGTRAAQVAAAVDPPAGRFTWRYPNTPPQLRRLWDPARITQITRGAVMMFEDEHHLTVDGFAGPHVWRALLADALAGKRRTDGYSYVYVHTQLPQLLTLWHNGRVVLTSPGNTGIPATPTAPGTFPVFEHIPVGEMKGTNPDGSHYDDKGIRWISYFHGGEALHAFNRASFGTPQSLGCVELPLAAAAKVWPYTPIGTLVTIEN